MDALCIPLRRKQDKWLDNCETCRLLNVSARTMQTYRDTGKLPYSQINNKIYYKISDVETFMQNHVKNNSEKIELNGLDNERFGNYAGIVFIP